MSPSLGDLKSDAGCKNLDQFLETRSYVEGLVVLRVGSTNLLYAIDRGCPLIRRIGFGVGPQFAHLSRCFAGVKKSLSDYGVTSGGDSKAADNDDDFELFGSDDEVDEEAERAKAERVAAYNEKKLQIVCVVEDDKVSIDWLTEEIEKFEDFVQSVDIAAFQKI